MVSRARLAVKFSPAGLLPSGSIMIGHTAIVVNLLYDVDRFSFQFTTYDIGSNIVDAFGVNRSPPRNTVLTGKNCFSESIVRSGLPYFATTKSNNGRDLPRVERAVVGINPRSRRCFS